MSGIVWKTVKALGRLVAAVYRWSDERWYVTDRIVASLNSALLPPIAVTVCLLSSAILGALHVQSAAISVCFILPVWLLAVMFNPTVRGWVANRYRSTVFTRQWEEYSFTKLGLQFAEFDTIRFNLDGQIESLVIKPNRPPKDHAKVAEMVRISVEGASTVTFNQPTPDWIDIRTSDFVLPDLYPLTEISDQEPVVNLGISGDGSPMLWDVTKTRHFGIFGRTGNGKGGSLRPILIHAARWGWEMTVLSGKPSGEFKWYTDIGGKFLYPAMSEDGIDIDSMCEMIDKFHKLMFKRAEVMTEAGLDRWEEHMALNPDDPSTVRAGLIIDEFRQFAAALSNRTGDKDIDKELVLRQKTVLKQVQDLTSMARSVGIHIIILTQKPDVAALGGAEFGGAILNNLEGRIVVPSSEMTIRQAMDETTELTAAGLPNIKGRVFHVALSGNHEPQAGQIGWIEQDDIPALLEQVADDT